MCSISKKVNLVKELAVVQVRTLKAFKARSLMECACGLRVLQCVVLFFDEMRILKMRKPKRESKMIPLISKPFLGFSKSNFFFENSS